MIPPTRATPATGVLTHERRVPARERVLDARAVVAEQRFGQVVRVEEAHGLALAALRAELAAGHAALERDADVMDDVAIGISRRRVFGLTVRADQTDDLDIQAALFFHLRSEERRVGKECRSRWST